MIFKVATFYTPRMGQPMKSHISAYTLWYNPAWEGCVEYEVDALTGSEAKKLAIGLRLQRERAVFYAPSARARGEEKP